MGENLIFHTVPLWPFKVNFGTYIVLFGSITKHYNN